MWRGLWELNSALGTIYAGTAPGSPARAKAVHALAAAAKNQPADQFIRRLRERGGEYVPQPPLPDISDFEGVMAHARDILDAADQPNLAGAFAETDGLHLILNEKEMVAFDPKERRRVQYDIMISNPETRHIMPLRDYVMSGFPINP